jgi:hypothetical protein
MSYQVVQIEWYTGVNIESDFADVFETTDGVPLEVTSGVCEC